MIVNRDINFWFENEKMSNKTNCKVCRAMMLFHFEIASNESSGIFYIKLNLQRLVVLQSPEVPLASFGYSAMA